MRRLDILKIIPSTTPGVPSSIEIGLDFTSIFHGKEWLVDTGERQPFYNAQPSNSTLLVATSFEIVDNAKYKGKYTVYTKPDSNGLASSEYSAGSGRTTIRVTEAMPVGTGSELTSGVITNISTYLLTVSGESSLVVLEQQLKTDRPVALAGRFSSGWGEAVMQNMLLGTQNFAGPSAPDKPFQGQLWFDTINGLLKIKPTPLDNDDWVVANAAFLGGPPYRHHQTLSTATWTVNHGLNLADPYIASCDFFVDTPNGVKPILPIDVTYLNADQLTVTFSNPSTGYVIVRS